MKPTPLPIVDRVLIRLFLSGSEAEFVVGDLMERYENVWHRAGRASWLGPVCDARYSALIGLGFGLIGTFWSTRVLSGFLYGVEPNDPLTLIGVTAVLVLVSVAACQIPARRATTVDPVQVLKAE